MHLSKQATVTDCTDEWASTIMPPVIAVCPYPRMQLLRAYHESHVGPPLHSPAVLDTLSTCFRKTVLDGACANRQRRLFTMPEATKTWTNFSRSTKGLTHDDQ